MVIVFRRSKKPQEKQFLSRVPAAAMDTPDRLFLEPTLSVSAMLGVSFKARELMTSIP